MGWRCAMRPYGSPKQLEQRRLQAAVLFKNGFQPVKIAKRLKVDRRSVRRWKASYLNDGPKSLKAQPAAGRPPKLSAKRRPQLEKLLLKGAQDAGYSTELWTCPRVAALIEKVFHIHYHVDHISRLLRSLGWTPQKPERLARERDEKAIKQWVRTTWPRIKKKPKN